MRFTLADINATIRASPKTAARFGPGTWAPIICVCCVAAVYLAPDYQRYALLLVGTEPLRIAISQVDLVGLGAVLLVGYALLRRATRVRVRREEQRLLAESWIIDTIEFERFHRALRKIRQRADTEPNESSAK